MRLIDADKLLGLFVESGQKHGREHGVKLGENWLLDYNDIKAVIDNAPTVEERPKGKWLPKGRWHIDPQCIEYACSICGRRIMREERLNVIEQYPFCHCGADMRGDKWTDTSES